MTIMTGHTYSILHGLAAEYDIKSLVDNLPPSEQFYKVDSYVPTKEGLTSEIVSKSENKIIHLVLYYTIHSS